jgi:hypothetical protein
VLLLFSVLLSALPAILPGSPSIAVTRGFGRATDDEAAEAAQAAEVGSTTVGGNVVTSSEKHADGVGGGGGAGAGGGGGAGGGAGAGVEPTAAAITGGLGPTTTDATDAGAGCTVGPNFSVDVSDDMLVPASMPPPPRLVPLRARSFDTSCGMQIC